MVADRLAPEVVDEHRAGSDARGQSLGKADSDHACSAGVPLDELQLPNAGLALSR